MINTLKNHFNALPLFCWLPVFCGLTLTPLLEPHNILVGGPGVDYYAEVHQMKWNSIMHTIGMPFTIYGFLISAPALLNLSPPNAIRLQQSAYIFYATHYFMISPKISIVFCAYYGVPWVFAIRRYNHNPMKSSLIKSGLITSFIALLFQEVVGHYMGGDNPSRLEGIPNAMLYALYYSVCHWF